MTARIQTPDGTGSPTEDETLDYRLSLRLGAGHARQRLDIEQAFEARLRDREGHFCHVENWYSLHGLVRFFLRATGLWGRGQRNARSLRFRTNRFTLPHLPAAFEGFRILHLTDLHVEMDQAALDTLIQTVADLDYDLCVLTGDYRKLTWGPIHEALEGMGRLRAVLKDEPLAILGNHDSIRMVPGLEDQGYRMLINEHHRIDRDGESLYIAGVDDPHFYKVDNLEQAADGIPAGAVSILLSHTPEIWREAANAGYDAYLCGHTHGGQICLPGGFPLTLDADCPRRVGKGPWHHDGMQGYTSAGSGTSVVNVRLNCPPEVTLHTLTRGPQ